MFKSREADGRSMSGGGKHQKHVIWKNFAPLIVGLMPGIEKRRKEKRRGKSECNKKGEISEESHENINT
jgi:hypothetical protein